jgi:hypothetical protein
MDELDVVTVDRHATLLVHIRGIPDVQTKFIGRRPEKIRRTVSILVNPNEGFRHRIDGKGLWICEHSIVPSCFIVNNGAYYDLVIANEASIPI